MTQKRWYISTIGENAPELAERYHLGLELAEFCTAVNMEGKASQTREQVRRELEKTDRCIVHGPFNELFPCAIDPKARELAAFRYLQAAQCAKEYGAKKLVLHGGFQPFAYYECWYVEQSILFWKELLEKMPENLEIVLENVLETTPDSLRSIVSQVNSPRLRLCLDVGHVLAYSQIPPEAWVESWKPWLSHFHLHNNFGKADTHNGLCEGVIPMGTFLPTICSACPEATMTLEIIQPEQSLRWLEAEGFLEGDPR